MLYEENSRYLFLPPISVNINLSLNNKRELLKKRARYKTLISVNYSRIDFIKHILISKNIIT